MSLTKRILLAMVFGLVVGSCLNLLMNAPWLSPAIAAWIDQVLVNGAADAVGQIFVASLKVLVVPLVFVSLVCGTSSLGNNSRMGAMAGKTLLLYMFTTAVAISLALLLATIVRPGDGIGLGEQTEFAVKSAPSIKEVIINIFPSNPVKAMAEGNMLQIIVFALLMGIAISRSGEQGKKVAAFFNDFDAVIMKMVSLLMELAPYGVFCLLVKLFATLGYGALAELSFYVLTVITVLFLHGLGVYGLLFKFFTGLNPLLLFKRIRPVMLFAFSTASSSATVPVTLKTLESRVGVDNRVASFTVPLGATINMDGTAIMQGVATAFIAQAYGIDIGLGGYLTVILTATLASVGTAGVPGVGLITLAMVLQQVGLPVEGIGLIIGVDRLLDMIRTAVNVTGDSMVTASIAHGEGALDHDVFNSEIPDTNDEETPLTVTPSERQTSDH